MKAPCGTGSGVGTSTYPDQRMEARVLYGASGVFEKGKKNKKSEAELEKERLLKTIGQQKIEIDFLKDALR